MKYDLVKTYLQWARCTTSTQVHCRKPKSTQFPYPPNLAFAMISNTYIFSYMSVVAFVNAQIGFSWQEGNQYLLKRYPSGPITNLLRFNIREVKESLKELCFARNIPRIDKEEPRLWNDLNQVLKEARDYFIHPKPDPDLFQEIMDNITKRQRGTAVQIAEGIIKYFYIKTGTPVPDWLSKNVEFNIPQIESTFAKEDV